jgi:hypothetical protein
LYILLSPKIPFFICLYKGSLGFSPFNLVSIVFIIGLLVICSKVDTVVKGPEDQIIKLPVINDNAKGTAILIDKVFAFSK